MQSETWRECRPGDDLWQPGGDKGPPLQAGGGPSGILTLVGCLRRFVRPELVSRWSCNKYGPAQLMSMLESFDIPLIGLQDELWIACVFAFSCLPDLPYISNIALLKGL